ncbi:PilW family protein [Wenzhouxiangella marina]|uniref:Uncharacterized protein n=1 Tax=Wenzhouxiangella marina TaxID=1579979 RepID=A0A0K0XSH2_9GAMM|nr:PilW family protein [Wenzhouxiangella marina]AKS40633.1 hypothetical protein WM2015_244 [Wenzhouxiangella marina]MBB6088401.1 type IV pilus assembly protein PilW [Wenzhouxiangella marina]
MMHFFSEPDRQRGVSLVELMVALVLGLLVTAGVLQLFAGQKMTYMNNEGLARVQENGRFAIETLKREVRAVGANGFCAARTNINNHLREDCAGYVDAIFDPNQSFTGWEFDGTGRNEDYTLDVIETADSGDWGSLVDGVVIDLPDILEDRVVKGSDVLVIRSLEVIPGLTAKNNNKANSSSIVLEGDSLVGKNAIVLVTNCSKSDLFQNRTNENSSSFSAGTGNCASPGPGNNNKVNFSTAYDDSMQVFRVRVMAYYIGINQDTGQPGLYRADMSLGTENPVHEELAEGIESLQVLYGYSLPANQGGDGQSVDFWVPGDEVPDWAMVIGIRMSLLVRSPDLAGGAPVQQVFDLSGTRITNPSDNRMRRPFLATVSLRNRQITL